MSQTITSLFLENEAATIALAKRVVKSLPRSPSGWTLLLEGELGAGKSTLARAMLHALGHVGPVPSPTYTLIEPYDLAVGMVYHIDLYRVSETNELRYLGFNELDDGFRLIEWPDRAPDLVEEADLRIRLAYEGDGRRAEIEPLSARAKLLHQKTSIGS